MLLADFLDFDTNIGPNIVSDQRRVLHVDDDPQILRLFENRLKKEGYEVFSLDDPTKTLDTLLNIDCRIVLLDIDMPGINGLQLLDQIKAYDGGIQVIMLTGLVTMTTVLESMRRGAEACFFKPLDDIDPMLEALEQTVTKVKRWRGTLEDLLVRKKGNESQVTDHFTENAVSVDG